METPQTQLTVSRTLRSDLGTRDVILVLDDQPFATLHYGESVTRDILPGPHRLYAHNTLINKTVEFNALAGEHIRFVTSNYGGLWTWIGMLFGAGPVYLSLQQES